jgi:large subunit ribosomal protein L4e
MPPKKSVNVFDLEGKPIGKADLPAVFSTPLRPDVVKRAVLSIQSQRLQRQGRDPLAGKRTSAESRGTGMAIARVPRIKGGAGTAAFAPGTVGGRQAHPPVVEKIIIKRISKREKQLGLFSAIAATASKEAVSSRGHAIADVPQIPLVVNNAIESLTKTKDVEEALIHLGILSDIYRVRESRNIRAGKGKLRGRKNKQAIGPLIVVVEGKGLVEAASNIPGVDVVTAKNLNAELLAPGTHQGRLTVWTSGALEELDKLYAKGETD